MVCSYEKAGSQLGLPPFWRLDGGCPFWLLVFDYRHLPACRSRLRGLAFVVVGLLTPTGVTSRGPRSWRSHFARCINLDLCLHGGVGCGIFICYDQQLVEGRRLVAEKPMLEEGADSMACTSCTPSQELRSSAQRVR